MDKEAIKIWIILLAAYLAFILAVSNMGWLSVPIDGPYLPIGRDVSILFVLISGAILATLIIKFGKYIMLSMNDLIALYKGILGSLIKYVQKRRANPRTRADFNTFTDYYFVKCIYGFSLAVIGGILIYSSGPINTSIGILIIITYYICEIRLIFYSESIYISLQNKAVERFKSWRSWPTPGMIVASLLLLPYFLIRTRDRDYLSWCGFKKMWVVSRHLITHPKLPGFESKDDKTLGRLTLLKSYADKTTSFKTTTPAKSDI